LQTRAAKRTPRAALRIVIDLVHEELITRQEALERIAGIDLAALAQVALVSADQPVLAGIGASGGIAVGRAAFCSESAGRLSAAGDPVILMRPDTSTADVAGFAVAAGIVTSVGARTAHAALVARQMGKPCIVGCGGMTIDLAADQARLAGSTISGSDWITIDGDSGHIYLGRRETIVTRPEAELAEIASWRSFAHEPDHGRRKPKSSPRHQAHQGSAGG
jgi:pyruvate,orthophosphate dikinase